MAPTDAAALDEANFPPAGSPALSPAPTGHHRPASLVLHQRPPKLVYLDLNHWVELARANAGHREGERFRHSLSACVDAVDRGAALFPLADSIYYEVSRIGPHRQRKDLADVMQTVSRWVTVTSRSTIADHEVEAMLDRLVGRRPEPIRQRQYLGWGIHHAFGRPEPRWSVVNTETGEDVTEWVRATHPRGPDWFDAVLADGNLRMNRDMIEGPSTPEAEAELRSRGWDPYVAHESMKQRAQQQTDQAGRLDARWRRGRIRDVIAVTEVLTELMAKMDRGLAARGADTGAVFRQDAEARAAFAEMPSYDVAVTMKASYHRDATRTWTPNDVNDIDALGSTLPYCDIVVTDKAVAAHARRTGLAARLGGTVLSRLDELVPLL